MRLSGSSGSTVREEVLLPTTWGESGGTHVAQACRQGQDRAGLAEGCRFHIRELHTQAYAAPDSDPQFSPDSNRGAGYLSLSLGHQQKGLEKAGDRQDGRGVALHPFHLL